MSKRIFENVSAGRRRNMQANRSKDTKPEMIVRRALHAAGFRFRLHRKDLPGAPDITLPALRTVIEVQGCFWHGHGCALGKLPQSRRDYWGPKIAATQARDRANRKALTGAGWQVIELWECDLKNDSNDTLSRLIESLRSLRSHTQETC
jgi:DNA mismatch endonuclease, patch repair protein